MEYLIPILRTAASLILLMVITMVIGKHMNSHKNIYSFALSVTVGSYIANMGFDMNLDFEKMVISFLALVIMSYVFMVLSSRSRKLRKWLSGTPTVLIEKGKILDHNMKKIKISIDDLNQFLREKDVFNIDEVEYALLEVSGELSILKKKTYQNTTKQDLNVPNSSGALPVELIMDGKIIIKNDTGNYNRAWIEKECQKRKLQIEEIYYAVVNSNGYLFIDKYEDQLASPTDVE